MARIIKDIASWRVPLESIEGRSISLQRIYFQNVLGLTKTAPLVITISNWKLLLHMRDVTCQCLYWLSVAHVNSVEGEKWLKTSDCFRISKAWKCRSLFYSPIIRAFHSLSNHILQILLTPCLTYSQNPTNFNQLHHWFWFDLIWLVWLSVITVCNKHYRNDKMLFWETVHLSI